MLLLLIIYVVSVLLLLCYRARLFVGALWSPARKGLTSWLSFVVSYCGVVHFPIGVLGQVWCLIVSIPGLKVIKREFILRLKIKHNDWLLADTCPQSANHCALF